MVGFYLLAIGLSVGLFWLGWIGAHHGVGGLKLGLSAAVGGGTVLLSLRPRRTMILGLPLWHVVTVDQLKAIVAHEFGHKPIDLLTVSIYRTTAEWVS